MNIEICYRNSYGRDLCYPVCNNARNFCKLAGTKTLSNYHLKVIKDMGYELKPVAFIPSNMEIA
tara:strand:+ start:365 stop:556 length:192 start_codon:yes stop_codon:yes gene_type:complete